MKWNKNSLLFSLLLLLTAWFSTVKINDAAFIADNYTSVSIRIKSEGIKKENIAAALEREKNTGSKLIPEVTAWTPAEEAEIKNTELNRAEKVTAVVVAGDMSVTAPMSLVCGNFVYKEDDRGCILDTKTAYSLFGTINTVDNTVSYENKNYCIRGVVKTPVPVFMIQGTEDDRKYLNLELNYKEPENGEVLAVEFLMQNGLAQNYVSIDGYFYGRLIHSFLCLPVWLFYSIFGFCLLKQIMQASTSSNTGTSLLYILPGFLILAGFGLLVYQYTGNPLYLPDKIIPTKWSDFDYWTKLWKDIKNNIQQIRYLPPNSKDVFLADELLKLNLNCTQMITLYMFLFYRVRKIKNKYWG